MRYFDCAVIGTGPAGQKAAIQAAKLGGGMQTGSSSFAMDGDELAGG